MQDPFVRETKSAAYYSDRVRFASFVSFFGCPDRRTDESLHPIIRSDYEALEDTRTALRASPGAFRAFYDDPEGYARDYFRRIGARLRAWFPDLPEPELFLTDSLSGVFSGAHASWDAMCAEPGNAFGIEPGIYFNTYRLTHVYYEFLIAHEWLHWAVGALNGAVSARTAILEEGVCDFLALYLTVSELELSDSAAENLLLYNRAYVHHNPLCKSYWFALQNTSRYVRSQGISGLLNLISSGGRQRWCELLVPGESAADLAGWERRLCDLTEGTGSLLQLPLSAYGVLHRSLAGHSGVSASVGETLLHSYGLAFESTGAAVQPNDALLLSRVRYWIEG